MPHRSWPRRLAPALLAFVALIAAAPAVAQPASPAATPATTACAAGSSGLGDDYFPTMGNGGYDVRHYDLDLDLDVAAGAIAAGRATLDATALFDLCAFNLDFWGLTVDAVSVDGQPATHAREGDELTITPSAPIRGGAPFVVDVAYHGAPSGERVSPTGRPSVADATHGARPSEGQQFGGGWFVAPEEIFVAGEPGGAATWYPVNEHPADKATYTFRLSVPDPYAVVANGVLAETTDDGAGTTSVWEARDPVASYLVTLHAGRLDVVETVGADGLPIRTSFAEGVPAEQRAVFERQPEILAHFATLFGPYPFEVAGATVVGVPLGFALETQTIPIFGGSPPDARFTPDRLAALESILVHEQAHQWFGDSVTPLRWRDIWLNEGFASYAQALWLEHDQGVDARDRLLRQWYDGLAAGGALLDPEALAGQNARQVLEAFERVLGRPLGAEDRERYLSGLGAASLADLEAIPAERGLDQLGALGVPAQRFPGTGTLTGDPGPANLFDVGAVYNRGALAVHALRLDVGDDAFFAILREWTRRYGGGNASIADFVALAEEIAARDLSPLFDAWLMQPALPPLALPGLAPPPAATPAA